MASWQLKLVKIAFWLLYVFYKCAMFSPNTALSAQIAAAQVEAPPRLRKQLENGYSILWSSPGLGTETGSLASQQSFICKL